MLRKPVQVRIFQTVTKPSHTILLIPTTSVSADMTAVMSALTLAVGIGRMVWLGMITVWKVLTWTGYRSIAMFLFHTAMATAFVVSLVAMVAWMGIVRGAMLLWQGAIWLVNAALLANPIVWIVVGVVALIAAVAAAVYYWDEWTTALLNSEAFKWVSDQLQGLSDWFSSMDGWTGMAKAAWDGIINIFKGAINDLIEMLNKIPGVQIDAAFGDLPAPPQVPDIGVAQMQAQPAPPLVMAQTPVLPPAAAHAVQPLAASQPGAMSLATSLIPPTQAPALVTAAPPQAKAEQSQERLNSSLSSLSPSRPNAVPKGGLLSSIQNTSQTQNKATHVENLNITNTKPMSPLELENMMSMAVGG